MLELLLRLLGIKRKRRKVYAQPPLPGAPQTRPSLSEQRSRPAQAMPAPPGQVQEPSALMKAAAEQTAESARAVARKRARERGGAAALPLIGRFFTPPKRSAVAMPLAPGSVQVRRATEADNVASPSTSPVAKRPKRGLGGFLRSIGRDISAAWAGSTGRFVKRTAWIMLIYVAPAAAVGVPSWIVFEEMRAIGIEVAPISVPDQVVRAGRTPEVLGRLLIDQLELVRRDALVDRADRWPRDLPGRQPALALAGESGNLRRAAVWLRSFTPNPVRRITGAVTELPNGTLGLNIYMTGMNQGAAVAALEGFDANALPSVVAGAAPLLLRASAPKLYAWYVASREGRPERVQTLLNGLLTDPASGSVDRSTRDAVEYLIGITLVRAGRVDEAREASDLLVARAPDYAPAHFLRAVVLAARDDNEGALAAVERAATLDGNTAWSHKARGRILNETGKLAEGLVELRTARRLDPTDGDAAVMEVNTLLSLRRGEEAGLAVRTGLERAPGHPGLQEAAAVVMLGRGRPDMALGFIDGELRLRPERVSAMLAKARIMIALRRGADALLIAEQALRLQPSNGAAQMTRGFALLATQRPTDALAAFDRLLQAAPAMPALMQGRAMALVMLGRREEATVLMREVLALQPDNRVVQFELDRLEGRTPVRPGAAPPAAPAQADTPVPAPQNTLPTRVAPIDVGPAPAARPAPVADPSIAPAAPGAFTRQPGQSNPGVFRRPDATPPAP